MARITRQQLDELCSTVAAATDWDLWLQKSATGLTIQKSEGLGAKPLGECMSNSECKEFLRGLLLGALTFRG